MRQSFAAKVFSPLLGYGADFELLQYVYYLVMWSRLGGAKNRLKDMPLRVLMKDNSFSPLYWMNVLFGLIDMVRQLGPPTLFYTISPYEWSFPYHVALLDEMSKLRCRRQQLPIFETLHMSRCILEA